VYLIKAKVDTLKDTPDFASLRGNGRVSIRSGSGSGSAQDGQ
jgi:hypothetical protein